MPNPRLPRQLKIVRGTFRADRNPGKEPDPEKLVEIPKAPSHLPHSGKQLWKKLVAQLLDVEMLTEADLPALEACCLNYGLYRELYRAITTAVDPVTGKKKKRGVAEYLAGRNSQTMPEYIQMTKAFATFKSYLTEFGLTPASRNRIDLPTPKEPETDPMEELIDEAE